MHWKSTSQAASGWSNKNNMGEKGMIIRGTTPTLTFGLPFEADLLETGFVIIQQQSATVIEKELSACECSGRTVSAKLTQEESLKLSSDQNAEIRLVVKTVSGDRLETKPIFDKVVDTSKDGVI